MSYTHDGDEFLNTSGDGADLLYATLNEGEWQIETVDSRGDVGKFPSLALDSAGRPHLTYLEWTAEHSAIVKYAFHDGSSWQFEVIDQLDDIEIAFFGARRTTAIAVDGSDHAYAAYSDRSVLRFGRRTDDGWANEDVAVRSGPALGQFVTLDLDADARPHLAYHDIVDPTASSTGTVYYALGPEVIDQPTAIDDDGVTTPDRFELGDNFPNPYQPGNGHTVHTGEHHGGRSRRLQPRRAEGAGNNSGDADSRPPSGALAWP